MKKRLTSFILVLALSFSLFSVSAYAEFTTTDSRTLTDIYKVIQYLNLSPGSWQHNSVIGFLERILYAIPSNLSTNFALQGGDGTNSILDDVRKWTMFTYNSLTSNDIAGNLGDIQRNTLSTADRIISSNTLLGSINDSVSGINGFVKEDSFQSALGNVFYSLSNDANPSYDSSLARFLGRTFAVTSNGILRSKPSNVFSYNIPWYNPVDGSYNSYWGSFSAVLGQLISSLGVDGQSYGLGYQWTLYHYVKNLSDTLASEDDKQLAENQKENLEQAGQDFLGGQSGPTSLGKGDFSNASQVGSALNDTFNMGGAAKVSDFLSGFVSAGSESQAWFSQTTSNNLNAVEAGDGTSGVSTFADDGETMIDVDPDPYNMRNIFERYDWLEGVDMDD